MELEFGGKRYPITAGENAIGTARACTIVVTGEGVRSRHAMLYRSPVGIAVRALAPDAVVLVNGTRVGGEPQVVRHGDRIMIGRQELLVVDPEPAEVGAPAGASGSARASSAAVEAASMMVAPSGATYRLADTMHGLPVAAWPSGAGAANPAATPAAVAPPALASFLVRAGEQKGHRLAVRRPSATIGRAEYNDVVVKDPSVSAEHARLRRRDGLWLVIDAGSTNGTYVDGELAAEETPLVAGASVRVGEVTLLFEPYDDEPVADRSRAIDAPAHGSVSAPAAAARAARPAAAAMAATSDPEPSRGISGWLIVALVAAAAAGAAAGFVLLR